MEQRDKQKKHLFRGFAVVMAAALMVGWNGLFTFAEESQSVQASDADLGEYDDSGGNSDSGNEDDADNMAQDEKDTDSEQTESESEPETEEPEPSDERTSDMPETESGSEPETEEPEPSDERTSDIPETESESEPENRKPELEELCGPAEVSSEMIELYAESPFSDEKGLSYRIIDGSDNVEVKPNSNYGTALSESLDIPDKVKNGDKTYNVVKIANDAFSDCSRLRNVTIPSSVTEIGKGAFCNCANLQSVTIPVGISIGAQAFQNCSGLSTLKISMSDANGLSPVTVVDADVFEGCPDERNVVFVLEDGTELSNTTTPALKDAIDAYQSADDGDTTDYLWYGWKLPELHAVRIQVQKDNVPWDDNNREFALKATGSDMLIMDLDFVRNGTYELYDITESSSGVASGIPITIDGSDIDAVVDYYTVTFYDGDLPYGDDTSQSPQIVLKNQTCTEPAAPQKDGYTFRQWMTTIDGDVPFDFKTGITAKTDIYASWEVETQKYTITASRVGNGSITPEGEVEVEAGENMTFTFEPDEGSYIKEVIVDGGNVMIGEDTSYTFENVEGNHTIEVVFESDESDDDQTPGDEPGEDEPGTGDDAPGTGGDDTPGPGEDEPGTGGDDTPESGDDNTGTGGGDDTPGDDTPGPGDDTPGDDTPGDDTPGPGDDTPGDDTPGSGDDNPGIGDDNTPGPGDDNAGTGDDNTPGSGDDNAGTGDNDTPGSGDDNAGTGGGDDTPGPGDDNAGTGDNDTPGDDKPGTGGDDTPGTGGGNPGTGDTPGTESSSSEKKTSQTSSNSAYNNSNDSSSSKQINDDIVPSDNNISISAYHDISNLSTDISSAEIVNDNTAEYNITESSKDNEPATGDESSIEIYMAIAIAAGLALLLFEFVDRKKYLVYVMGKRWK